MRRPLTDHSGPIAADVARPADVDKDSVWRLGSYRRQTGGRLTARQRRRLRKGFNRDLRDGVHHEADRAAFEREIR